MDGRFGCLQQALDFGGDLRLQVVFEQGCDLLQCDRVRFARLSQGVAPRD